MDDDEWWWETEEETRHTIVVHEEKPRNPYSDTGLITAEGKAIYRVDPPKPTIGFAHTQEWIDHDDQFTRYVTLVDEADEDEEDDDEA